MTSGAECVKLFLEEWERSVRKTERVTIEIVPAGLYRIEQEGQPVLIGGAASTMIALSRILFLEEAKGGFHESLLKSEAEK